MNTIRKIENIYEYIISSIEPTLSKSDFLDKHRSHKNTLKKLPFVYNINKEYTLVLYDKSVTPKNSHIKNIKTKLLLIVKVITTGIASDRDTKDVIIKPLSIFEYNLLEIYKDIKIHILNEDDKLLLYKSGINIAYIKKIEHKNISYWIDANVGDIISVKTLEGGHYITNYYKLCDPKDLRR